MVLVIGALSLVGAQQQRTDVAEKQKAAREERDKKLHKLNLAITAVGSEDDSTPRAQYHMNEDVLVHVSVTNTDDDPTVVVAKERYEQFFPHLLKDGQPVAYHQKAKERLADSSVPLRERSTPVKLAPHETGSLGVLFLRDWYGELEPGAYQLTVRFAFERNDAKVKTNTVAFAIVP
jgi:hypothetical protein